jgi:hypothetical protein
VREWRKCAIKVSSGSLSPPYFSDLLPEDLWLKLRNNERAASVSESAPTNRLKKSVRTMRREARNVRKNRNAARAGRAHDYWSQAGA